MRFVVYGAGAIGGALGVSLAGAGEEVVLIARGAQLEAIRARGLTMETPDKTVTLALASVGAPAEVDWLDDDAVLLAMKSQDTEAALRELSECAPPSIAVVCMQNGVENERSALRRFAHVYGAMVIAPSTYLTPGSITVTAAPGLGLIEVGRFPEGTDHRSDAIAASLTRAGWASRSLPDIMSWKHAKLLDNLSNAVQVVIGLDARDGEVAKRAKAEGIEVLDRAGIPYTARAEMAARRAEGVTNRPVAGRERVGASTWQSVARGTGSVESDYLNGEIAFIAREHGLASPVNELLQRISNEMARSGGTRPTLSEEEFLALAGNS